MGITPWDKTFMDLAAVYAARSKDPSTQVGAVIIGPDKRQRSAGYNGIARGLDDTVLARHVAPEKYLWYEHAERNAIFNAAAIGVSTQDCVIYVKGLPPCSRCARAIIQSGIQEVVVASLKMPDRWRDDMEIAAAMLQEAGIDVRRAKGFDTDS